MTSTSSVIAATRAMSAADDVLDRRLVLRVLVVVVVASYCRRRTIAVGGRRVLLERAARPAAAARRRGAGPARAPSSRSRRPAAGRRPPGRCRRAGSLRRRGRRWCRRRWSGPRRRPAGGPPAPRPAPSRLDSNGSSSLVRGHLPADPTGARRAGGGGLAPTDDQCDRREQARPDGATSRASAPCSRPSHQQAHGHDDQQQTSDDHGLPLRIAIRHMLHTYPGECLVGRTTNEPRIATGAPAEIGWGAACRIDRRVGSVLCAGHRVGRD